MFLGTVFVVIAILIYFIAFVELIIGIVLLVKKKKVPGIILLVLSAIPVVVTVVLLAVAYFTAEYPEFDTYDGGTVTINMEDVRVMKNIIRAKDMEGLNEYLDKHPELIYYQDNNHRTLLEYGLHDHNVEIMQIAIDHGAVFDAEPTFRNLRYNYSLENFFNYEYRTFALGHQPDTPPYAFGVATEDMIEAARFAVDHGAETVWKTEESDGVNWDFAVMVEEWVNDDGEISETDEELVEYARSVCRSNAAKTLPTREYFENLDKNSTLEQITAEIGSYGVRGSGIIQFVWPLDDGSYASVIFNSSGKIERITIDGDNGGVIYEREH